VSNETWLLVAFLAVWVAIGGYLWTLASRQRRLERRLSELNDQDQDPNH
jgi:CcmD family protein